jgi:hypothetical protein
MFLFASNIFAQSNPNYLSKKDSLDQCEKESEEFDIVDLYRMVIKKPVKDSCEPTKKAGKLHLAVLPAAGYSLVTKLAGVVAANAAFYADNEKSTKLSAVNFSIGYTQNNQIILPILSNIWTKKNNYNLLGDWRYYMYPEYTYGLGGHTSLQNSDRLNYSNIIIHEAVLKHLFNSAVYVGAAYNLNYHWNITETGNANGQVSDFKKYGLTKKSVSSGVSINALYDSRKNSINPAEAIYWNIAFCPNATFLGSDHNYQSLTVDLRRYFKPSVSSDNILAFWSYNWFTFNGNVPYLDMPSTAWDAYSNMGRGYIQSRFRGKNLLYVEAEYRFGITRNGFLGGVVFANAQSVTDWPSDKFQTIYPAVGTGIRLKINKHSNTNVCIDYAFGLNGSNGVFINLGEVF